MSIDLISERANNDDPLYKLFGDKMHSSHFDNFRFCGKYIPYRISILFTTFDFGKYFNATKPGLNVHVYLFMCTVYTCLLCAVS